MLPYPRFQCIKKSATQFLRKRNRCSKANTNFQVLVTKSHTWCVDRNKPAILTDVIVTKQIKYFGRAWFMS